MKASNKISLIQVNDTHAYLDLHPELFWEKGRTVYRKAGGYARIKRIINQIRDENPEASLFLDNGDTLHGTYPAVQTKGQVLVPILNQIGLDAMTAHWEFAYGPQVVQERVAELNYPLLALNIKYKDSKKRPFPGYQITEVGELKVGIVGLASNIVDKVMPPDSHEGLLFELGQEDLSQAVEVLRGQEKVDLVVVLSHLGFPQDMQIAADTPGINVILSGHTHNRLSQPARQGNTLLIQSGSHGSFVGCLDLTVEHGRVVDYHHRLIEVSEDIEPDPEVAELVQAALRPFEDELNLVVGETAEPLDRGQNQESTMDNLLLHAISASMGIELVFSNGWRYGAPVVAGLVKLNDLHNIIPVNPPISTVNLTGQEIWDMLEESLEHTYAHNPYNQMGGYLKRALGLRAYVKIENPFAYRLQKLFIGREEVQPDKTYEAAFVTEQGVPAKYGHNRQKHDLRAVDSLRQYLSRHRPVRIGYLSPFVVV